MMPLHYNRIPVVDGTASVHHRLAVMMRCFMDCGAVMDRAAFVYSRSVMSGTAFVHHGLCLVMGCFMYGRTMMGGAALVHHGLCFVMLCAPVHARTLLFGNVLTNRRAVVSGIASMHGRSCLMAGTAFMYRPDLLCLRGTLSAGMTGRSCFGNSHYERGAEKAGH